MTTDDIGRFRLAAQRITADKFETPEAAVKHLLAMQAQDYNGALWSVALRTADASRWAVEQAIADKKIIRTWPMRGTLHFVHADDVHWLLALTAPRATAAAKGRRINQLGLTDDIVAETETALRRALRGGGSIVRNQVLELFKDTVKTIGITSQHVQHLMRNFGERGVICFGPNQGKQPTFVLLDEWLPPAAAKPRDQVLGELAGRYFISHGPATLKDFSGWAMLTVADAKLGLAAAQAGGGLETASVDGTDYYYDAGLQRHAAGRHPMTGSCLLLPGFDEYLLGYKDRGAILAAEHADKIVPGGNGMFLPTVVNDKGQVIGLWKRRVTKAGVEHSYDMFAGGQPAAGDSERLYDRFLAG